MKIVGTSFIGSGKVIYDLSTEEGLKKLFRRIPQAEKIMNEAPDLKTGAINVAVYLSWTATRSDWKVIP